MKIQLDTDNKTIKLEDNVLLSKLIETLDRLLPNKEWKKFTLETNTTINHWSSPIVIREYPFKQNYWPWYQRPYYYTSASSGGSWTADYKVNGQSFSNNMQLKSGVFNLEV